MPGRLRIKLASNVFLAKSCENGACWELPRPLDHHIVMAARFVKTLVVEKFAHKKIWKVLKSALKKKTRKLRKKPHKKRRKKEFSLSGETAKKCKQKKSTKRQKRSIKKAPPKP